MAAEENDLETLEAIATSPDATDSERAWAANRLAAAQAEGIFSGAASGIRDVNERVEAERSEVPVGLGGMVRKAVGDVVGWHTRPFTYPIEVGIGAVRGAIAGAPGPDPQPVEIPKIEPQPLTPEDIAEMETASLEPEPQGAGGGMGIGLQALHVPSGGGQIRSAGRRAVSDIEGAQAGIEAAGQSQMRALDELGVARQMETQTLAEGQQTQAEVMRDRVSAMESEQRRRQEAFEYFKQERGHLQEQYETAVAAAKYHRMPESEVARRMERIRKNETILATYDAQPADGSPLSDTERRMIENAKMELNGDHAALDKASKMRGEWDFENPAEIFAAIAMTIGTAMGAYASGLTGVPNYALQIANTRADRIIQAQKDEIARREGVAEGYVNQLDMLRRQFGDEEMAEAAIFDMKLGEVEAALEQTAMQSTSEVTKQKAESVKAEIAQERANIKSGVASKAAELALQKANARLEAASGAARLDQQAATTNAQLDMQLQAATTRAMEKAASRDLSEYGYRHSGKNITDKQYQDAVDYAGNVEKVKHIIPKLIAYREDPSVFMSFFGIESPTLAAANAQLSRLINAMKMMEGMGANFTKMEKDLLEMQAAGGMDRIGFIQDKLRETLGAIEEEAQTKMKGWGFQKPNAGPSMERKAQ
jgi:hypothetical protein